MCSLVRLLVFLSLVSYASFAEQKNITLSTMEGIEIIEKLETYLRKSYNRIGYELDFVELPPGRATIIANSGNIDGVAARLTAIDQKYPALLRVPVLLVRGHLTVYCAPDVVCNESIINDEKSTIGGISHSALMLQYMNDKKSSLYLVDTHQNLAELFEKGRLDYIFSIELDNLGNFQNLDQNQHKVYLTELEAYHYLNQKHVDIIPELVSSLNQTIRELGPLNQANK